MKRKRLLFVVNADWFFVSHRLELAVACMRNGYDVAVCAGQSNCRAQIEARGIPFFPLPIDRGGTHPLRDARTFGSLLKTYRAFQPDIVHHVTIKPVLYGSLAARAAGVSAVINAVSGLGYAFIERNNATVAQRTLRSGLLAAYRLALAGPHCRVIFQNEEDRRSFTDARLVPHERTCLIPGSGVNLDQFVPRPLPNGPFMALLPARLLWDKGVGEFVAAARELKATHPEGRFVLVGRLDPSNPAAVPERQLNAWVAEGVVEWWPFKQHVDMPSVYSQAHLVVLPSYREGLPLALAEAAASARPVLTTDAPGCRDTVIDGVTGWLVRPRSAIAVREAMADALDRQDQLKAMGLRGRAFAEQRFSIEHIIQRTLETYEGVLR